MDGYQIINAPLYEYQTYWDAHVMFIEIWFISYWLKIYVQTDLHHTLRSNYIQDETHFLKLFVSCDDHLSKSCIFHF